MPRNKNMCQIDQDNVIGTSTYRDAYVTKYLAFLLEEAL